MEGNYLGADQCKSSSSETDRSEQSCNDEIGTGRSYECVFCKRGFTTAQALGGHMNIHRKDRVKSRPPTTLLPINMAAAAAGKSAAAVAADDHDNLNYAGGLRSYSYPPIFQSYHHHQPHYSNNISIAPHHLSYQAAFFPASPGLYVDNSPHHDLNSYPFGVEEDDCNWGRSTLSLRIGSSHADDDDSKKSTDRGSSSQDDELDLELRLGHHVHP